MAGRVSVRASRYAWGAAWLLAGACGKTDAPQTSAARIEPAAARAASQPAETEPTLPQVLEIVRDKADPSSMTARINPFIDGEAFIEITDPATGRKLNAAAAPALALRRGGSAIGYPIRLDQAAMQRTAAGGGAPRFKIDFRNAAGQSVMQLNEELPAAKPAAVKPDGAVAGKTIDGKTSQGANVRSLVPANAPAPVVEGSR